MRATAFSAFRRTRLSLLSTREWRGMWQRLIPQPTPRQHHHELGWTGHFQRRSCASAEEGYHSCKPPPLPTALTRLQIITFDKQGVSGHPNHVSLSTVSKYFPEGVEHLPEFITLESPSLAAKYTSALWAAFYALRDWARIEEPVEPGLGLTFIASPSQYLRGVRAMLAHETQMVWFRWLYISFSQLMWVNQLVSN